MFNIFIETVALVTIDLKSQYLNCLFFPLPFIRSLSILLVNVKCLCMYMMYESAFYYKLLTDMPECLLEFDAFYA